MWKLNVAVALAAFRTAGALMMGNAFVGYFVLDKHNLLGLFAIGMIGLVTIIGSSLEKGAVDDGKE